MVPQLFSGARGIVKVKTSSGSVKTLGVALDISISVSDGQQQTYVMGAYNAVAIDPTGTDVTVSFSTVIPVNVPTSSTPDLVQSSSIAQGFMENINTVLQAESLEISVTDKITDHVLGSVRGCRFTGMSMGLPAQGVATKRYNYTGIWDAGYDGKENAATLLGYDPTNA